MMAIGSKSIRWIALVAGLAMVSASPLYAVQVGLWNFNNNLNNDVPGKMPMSVNGAWTANYVTETIGGQSATVLSFPGFDPTQSLQMVNEAGSNGGGTLTNTWTMVMDVKFPLLLGFASFWQTSQDISANDGEFFVRNNADGIGIGGQYDGVFNENTWHRIAVTIHADIPLQDSVLLKYIDGVYVGDSFSGDVPDGRHAVGQFLHFFADEDFETIDGLVNSIAYYDTELSAAEIAALGAPTAAGIPFLPSAPDADFNNDGLLNCADVNSLTAVTAAGSNDPAFDLNGDAAVNGADLTRWLSDAGNANIGAGRPYKAGDANLDGVVDGTDFGLWNANKFTNNTAFCSGNFNGDPVTDGSDFGIWNANKFTASDGSLVPEPATGVLGLLIVAGLVSRSRRG